MDKGAIDFPLYFPIKIIGKSTPTFLTEIKAIVLAHYPDTPETAFVVQPSTKNTYQSITATVYATDQTALDALYQSLTRHPDIRMVL